MAEVPDPTAMVEIRPKNEPDTVPAKVTREAFDLIWADRGFVIAGAEPSRAPTPDIALKATPSPVKGGDVK